MKVADGEQSFHAHTDTGAVAVADSRDLDLPLPLPTNLLDMPLAAAATAAYENADALIKEMLTDNCGNDHELWEPSRVTTASRRNKMAPGKIDPVVGPIKETGTRFVVERGAETSDAHVAAHFEEGSRRLRRPPPLVAITTLGDTGPSVECTAYRSRTDDDMGLRNVRQPNAMALESRRSARERDHERRRALIENSKALYNGHHDIRAFDAKARVSADDSFASTSLDYKAAALRHRQRVESLWDKQPRGGGDASSSSPPGHHPRLGRVDVANDEHASDRNGGSDSSSGKP